MFHFTLQKNSPAEKEENQWKNNARMADCIIIQVIADPCTGQSEPVLDEWAGVAVVGIICGIDET